jgi:hypothetical protein
MASSMSSPVAIAQEKQPLDSADMSVSGSSPLALKSQGISQKRYRTHKQPLRIEEKSSHAAISQKKIDQSAITSNL